MSEDPGLNSALDAAIQRLDRATLKLERRIEALSARANDGGLFEHDRALLAAELDAARGREKELEAAGQQASLALGRAISDIRSALGEDRASEAAGAGASANGEI